MGAHVQCPRCDQAFALSDEQALQYAGREFECSQCNTRFVVPRSSVKGATAASALRGELPREQVTAGATRSIAAVHPFTPGFIPTAGYKPFDEAERIPGSGLATAALVCAVLGLIIPVVPSLLAIVLGFLAVIQIARGKAEGASLASGAVALGFTGLILGTVIFYQRVLPVLNSIHLVNRSTSSSPSSSMFSFGSGGDGADCPTHFKKVDAALKAYANAHDGKFPDGLDALVAAGLLTADQLICDAGRETKAVGTSNAEIAEHVRQPGHCSYVYAGKGLTTQSPPECVLVYEPLDAHKQPGMSVLFADGRVQSIGARQAARAMTQLSNGHNPPWD